MERDEWREAERRRRGIEELKEWREALRRDEERRVVEREEWREAESRAVELEEKTRMCRKVQHQSKK